MSDLLPNIDALVAQLTGDSRSAQDARALAEAARSAATEVGLDAALAEVVATWRGC